MKKRLIVVGAALLFGCDSTSEEAGADRAGADAQVMGNEAGGAYDGARADGSIPDGAYSCSKIEGGGGNYIHIGEATIRSGRVTSLALPDGWQIVSVTRGAPNDWSKTVAEVTYRTASGNTDKLECVPQ